MNLPTLPAASLPHGPILTLQREPDWSKLPRNGVLNLQADGRLLKT